MLSWLMFENSLKFFFIPSTGSQRKISNQTTLPLCFLKGFGSSSLKSCSHQRQLALMFYPHTFAAEPDDLFLLSGCPRSIPPEVRTLLECNHTINTGPVKTHHPYGFGTNIH